MFMLRVKTDGWIDSHQSRLQIPTPVTSETSRFLLTPLRHRAFKLRRGRRRTLTVSLANCLNGTDGFDRILETKSACKSCP